MKKLLSAFGKIVLCFCFFALLTSYYSASAQNLLCSAPSAKPSGLSLIPYSNNVAGSFLPSLGANGYLVIRTSTIAAPATPVDGVNYVPGTNALGGFVESAGSSTIFSSSALTPTTPYYYWIIPYTTALPCTAVTYGTGTPLNGTINTLACGAVNNLLTLPETGNIVWSAVNFSLGHLPTACEDVTVVCTGILPLNTTAELTIGTDIDVRNLSFINNSSAALNDKIFHVTLQPGAHLNISGDLNMSSAGARVNDSVVFISQGITTVAGNANIGLAADNGFCVIGASGAASNQTVIFKGNVTFNNKSSVRDRKSIFVLAANGAQILTNNINEALTGRALMFDVLKIGDGASTPVVTLSGTNKNFYLNDNAGKLEVLAGATLILPQDYTCNAKDVQTTNVFNSSLIVNTNATVKIGGDNGGYPGNNFPARFTSTTLQASSTIEYNGGSTITQQVYDGTAYSKLILSNGSGTGRAAKINAGEIFANNSVTVKAITHFNLGEHVTCGSSFEVQSSAALYCATNIVSGSGIFSLQPDATLGMGDAQGISSGVSATGNIQMTGGRNYSIAANYLFNGNVQQITGTGFPGTCHDLTTDNPSIVIAYTDINVTGSTIVKQGIFDIANTRLSAAGPLTFNGGKIKANVGILELGGASAQTISGNNFVSRNISTLINSNSSGITLNAGANDSLLISSRLLFGTGTINSAIVTNNNLTLLSRDTATAGFGEIVSGSGNSISGDVTVERYLGSGRKWRLLSWPTSSAQTAMQSWMENNTNPNENDLPGYGMIVTDEHADWSGNGFDSRSLSGPTVKYFNPSTVTYTGIDNTGSFQMDSKPAYFVFARGDRSCTPANASVSPVILRSTGALKTGTKNFPVPASLFATIGNPYASAVDLRKLDTSNLTTTFYVWDPKLTGTYGLGAYQTLYLSGADYRALPGGGSYGAINSIVNTIESGQAFFVRGRAGGGSIGFQEEAKTSGTQSMSRANEEGEGVYAFLSLKDPGETTLADGCATLFESSANNDVDFDDAVKIKNTSEGIGFKKQGQILAVERRSSLANDDTLFLNLSALRTHQYQWDIILSGMNKPGRTAFLLDRFSGVPVPLQLSDTTTVLFNVSSTPGSNAADRFMIIFRQTSVVPVHFTSVSAVRNHDKTISVRWETANEVNMREYVIERSLNGRTFSSIGNTPVQTGSAVYNFADISATTSANYYRIRGIGINGESNYSSVVKVAGTETKASFVIYPNIISGGTINLVTENYQGKKCSIQIISQLGQLMYKGDLILSGGSHTKTISISNTAAAGNYTALITDAAGSKITLPFIIR